MKTDYKKCWNELKKDYLIVSEKAPPSVKLVAQLILKDMRAIEVKHSKE